MPWFVLKWCYTFSIEQYYVRYSKFRVLFYELTLLLTFLFQVLFFCFPYQTLIAIIEHEKKLNTFANQTFQIILVKNVITIITGYQLEFLQFTGETVLTISDLSLKMDVWTVALYPSCKKGKQC